MNLNNNGKITFHEFEQLILNTMKLNLNQQADGTYILIFQGRAISQRLRDMLKQNIICPV